MKQLGFKIHPFFDDDKGSVTGVPRMAYIHHPNPIDFVDMRLDMRVFFRGIELQKEKDYTLVGNLIFFPNIKGYEMFRTDDEIQLLMYRNIEVVKKKDDLCILKQIKTMQDIQKEMKKEKVEKPEETSKKSYKFVKVWTRKKYVVRKTGTLLGLVFPESYSYCKVHINSTVKKVWGKSEPNKPVLLHTGLNTGDYVYFELDSKVEQINAMLVPEDTLVEDGKIPVLKMDQSLEDKKIKKDWGRHSRYSSKHRKMLQVVP